MSLQFTRCVMMVVVLLQSSVKFKLYTSSSAPLCAAPLRFAASGAYGAYRYSLFVVIFFLLFVSHEFICVCLYSCFVFHWIIWIDSSPILYLSLVYLSRLFLLFVLHEFICFCLYSFFCFSLDYLCQLFLFFYIILSLICISRLFFLF